MLGLKEEKKLAEKDIVAMHDLFGLIRDGKIPYSELEPLFDKYSGLIEAEIKRYKEQERQYQIRCLKAELEGQKNDVELFKKRIDDLNKNIAEMKAELEEQKERGRDYCDENRMKNLLWWIFNNETEIADLKDKIKAKEVQVMETEKALLLKQSEEK